VVQNSQFTVFYTEISHGNSLKEEHTELEESTHSHLLNRNVINNTKIKTSAKRSKLHAFTMTLALSVHSIFEGLALGLEEETSHVSK